MAYSLHTNSLDLKRNADVADNNNLDLKLIFTHATPAAFPTRTIVV